MLPTGHGTALMGIGPAVFRIGDRIGGLCGVG